MDRYVPQPKAAKPTFPTAAQLEAAVARAGPRRKPLAGDNNTQINPFQLPEFPPKARPPKTMAMDDALNANISWAGSVIASSFSEGVQFLGYPYLAELTQRPEYRVITETIAGEMVRKWIKFEAVGDEEKTEEIKQLDDRFKELEVQDHFKQMAEQDGYFGRAHLYIDTGATDDRDELQTPIGDGQNSISKAKIAKGSLKRLKAIEAIWTYPQNYDSIDPLKPDWYNPQQWFVMGKHIHVSRLLTFVGRPVPDMLKPAYSFGGLSLSQIAKPYVDNWLTTRQSVNDLIHSFVVWGLATNLSESLQVGGEQLFQRIELFNRLRDNRGCMITDKDTEEFNNITAPLGTLDALQAQSQEHMAAVSRIPLVKLLGIQPAGLNASSEGEIRVFYDTIHSYQHSFFRKNLTRLMHFVMLDLWGAVDPKITFSFEPLYELSEKEKSDMRKTDAETGQILVDTGIVSQEEERKRIANDPSTPYPGLDWQEMPDLRAEIAGGLEPEGGRPQPEAGGPEDPDQEVQQHEHLEHEEDAGAEHDVGGEGEEGEDATEDGVGTARRSRIDKVTRLVTGGSGEPTPAAKRTGKLVGLIRKLDAAE
jgi:phage-related protein (TIGR01555 family)